MNSRPVALSRDLPKNRVMRAEVDGVDLAVWRNSKGALAAWNNRCPHRGMRLSHGFVRGDRLACLYHGWQYGSDGKCAYIPAHPSLEPPETICTTRYSITEDQGIIWVSVTGEAGSALSGDGYDALRSFGVQCGEARVLEAVTSTPFHGTDVTGEGGGIYRAGSLKVCVLLNATDGLETLVHVMVEKGASLAERRALSRWCEALRRYAETGEGDG